MKPAVSVQLGGTLLEAVAYSTELAFLLINECSLNIFIFSFVRHIGRESLLRLA